MNPEFPPDVHRFDISFGTAMLKGYDSDPNGINPRTILLLHGSGGSAAGSFWALLPMLALRHRVVTFDFLDPADSEAEAEFYVGQARATIAAIGGPVDLVGYSFGAVIAAELAAADQHAIRSLVLVAGWARTDSQQVLRNEIWRELHDDRHSALGKFSVFMTYGQPFINSRTPDELRALIRANGNGAHRAAKMRFNRSVDIVNKLDEVSAATLVVGCELDQTAPIRHSHLLFGGIENARLIEIHCGHGVVHERPAELAMVIEDFVADPARHAPGTVIANAHA
jgi:pimeloyl-ACP methyl ester carboxylesterase